MVCAGPSCVPWSRDGLHKGWEDERSKCFLHVLQCIIDQGLRARSTLKAFVLENVSGFCDRRNGNRQTPAEEVTEWIMDALAHKGWRCWYWKVQLSEQGYPQSRTRVYMCGRRECFFHTPGPNKNPFDFEFTNLHLRQILDDTLEDDMGSLTDKCKENLKHYIKAAKDYDQDESSVMICDLSRSPDSVRKTRISVDCCPTVQTHNNYLFAYGLNKALPQFKRYLTVKERAMLQGFDPTITDRFRTLTASRRVVGNAMALPSVGLCIACTLSGIKG
eukprot:9474951-Pyramimonas_sp.AAC.1